MPKPWTATPVAEVAAKKGTCIAVYGAPGVGKTPQAGFISLYPFGQPAEILDVEGGLDSVKHLSESLGAVPLPDGDTEWKWPKIKRMIEWYEKAPLSEIDNKLLILDNMSEIAEVCLWHHTSDTNQTGGARNSPEIQHYKRCTIDMRWLTRTCRDIAYYKGLNIILVAWEAPEKDEATGIIKRDVAFSPGFAREFPGLIDIVAWITVDGQGQRMMNLGATNRSAARFRRTKFGSAAAIPDKFPFGYDDHVLADIINTIRYDQPWPSKYRPA